MEIKEALEEYINHINVVDQKALRTIESYRRDLTSYTNFMIVSGIKGAESITYDDIQKYIHYLSESKSAASINRSIVSIRCFHKYLGEYFPSFTNPTLFLKNKKVGRRLPKLIAKEDVLAILDFEEENKDKQLYHQCILELLYGCGLRVSECCDLLLKQIHLSEGFLRVIGKGDKERMIPVNKHAISLLTTYLNSVRTEWNTKRIPFLFVNHLGNKLTRQYVDKIIKNRCQELSLNPHISAHSFRHSFASHMLDGNADLRIVQELLGHADISTTQIYTHVQSERLRKSYLSAHPMNKSNKIKD